jgi:hypothetical protein
MVFYEYIHAQSGIKKNAGQLQNFVTDQEASSIEDVPEFMPDVLMHEQHGKTCRFREPPLLVVSIPGKKWLRNPIKLPYYQSNFC